MLRDERTIQFSVWPHLITIEGPAAKLASVIEVLYNDSRLPREDWSLANSSGVGRRAMAQNLRGQGDLMRRVGIAALTSPVSDAIERRVRAAGVKCFAMHMPGSLDA